MLLMTVDVDVGLASFTVADTVTLWLLSRLRRPVLVAKVTLLIVTLGLQPHSRVTCGGEGGAQ